MATLGWDWHMGWTKRILLYGLPALSIPLADPMMTAVDTLFVGQVRSTPEPHRLRTTIWKRAFSPSFGIAPGDETRSVRSLVSPRS